MEFCVKVATEGILREVINHPNQNAVMSPSSLNLVLNMAAWGSSGETLKQFLGCLGLETIIDLSSKSSSLMALHDSDRDTETTSSSRKNIALPQLSLVKMMFVDHTFTLKPLFKEEVRNIYKTEPKMVDFINQAKEVRNEVNSWAEKNTKGLIKDFLPSTEKLEPPLSLANALYFKAAWSDPFIASSTKDEDFHLLDGKTIRVPFMTQLIWETQSYGSFEDFKVIRLYYATDGCLGNKHPRFCMDIILPERKNGLQDLLDKFNSDTKLLLLQDSDLKEMKINKIWIPKWKFSYGLDMVELMKKLGLTLPFHKRDADFTNMMDCQVGDDPIYIEKMIQKSFISVDEKGTEGASISGGGQKVGLSRYRPPEVQFVADHPFMFIIRVYVSEAVIFIGAVLNPLSHN